MSILSRIIEKVYKLPPANTHDIVVERGLEIPMPDGVILCKSSGKMGYI
jgi:hypothetical protein